MACPHLVPRRRVGEWRAGKRGGVSQPSVPLQVPLCRERDGWQAEIRAVDVNCVVVTINYRHAPEHVFSAAHDDALAAWRWVSNPATTGLPELDLGRIAIGGLSAYLPPATSAILALRLTENATQRRQPRHIHRPSHRHGHHPANLPTSRMSSHRQHRHHLHRLECIAKLAVPDAVKDGVVQAAVLFRRVSPWGVDGVAVLRAKGSPGETAANVHRHRRM